MKGDLSDVPAAYTTFTSLDIMISEYERISAEQEIHDENLCSSSSHFSRSVYKRMSAEQEIRDVSSYILC